MGMKQEGTESKDEFSERSLMSQHNTCVSPTGERPAGSERQEVSGVMRKNRSLCGGGKNQLGGIVDSEVTGVAGGQTIDPMLAEDGRQDNRDGFVEIDSHGREVDRRPGSSAAWAAIS